MARYRVGNRYLSEEEHAQHIRETWQGLCFMGGALLAGVAIYQIIPQEWEKWLRTTLIVLAAGLTGTLLGYFAHIVRFFLLAALTITCIAFGLRIIWENI